MPCAGRDLTACLLVALLPSMACGGETVDEGLSAPIGAGSGKRGRRRERRKGWPVQLGRGFAPLKRRCGGSRRGVR
jgi:hypothetical protein